MSIVEKSSKDEDTGLDKSTVVDIHVQDNTTAIGAVFDGGKNGTQDTIAAENTTQDTIASQNTTQDTIEFQDANSSPLDNNTLDQRSLKSIDRYNKDIEEYHKEIVEFQNRLKIETDESKMKFLKMQLLETQKALSSVLEKKSELEN